MISVIVPVYNEENGVVASIEAIARELNGFVDYEIIAVNDGSTDKSLERISSITLSNFKVINHMENLGYGKSLYDGIVSAKYNCIAIIDADGSYPAKDIKTLYQYYPEYDMVVGARSGHEYKKGIFKKPARRLFKFLAEYTTGRNIPDINSGLRIFRKDVVLAHKDSLCTGFSFTTTITLIFMLNHLYVKYVPIEYLKRKGKSKVNHFKDTLRAGQVIVEAILYYNPIKLFLLLASWNAVLGALAGVINHLTIKSDFIATFAAISLASFMPLMAAGFVADQLKQIYKSLRENK
jgi:glycosyltransferase involved in cell wall biosynthesis